MTKKQVAVGCCDACGTLRGTRGGAYQSYLGQCVCCKGWFCLDKCGIVYGVDFYCCECWEERKYCHECGAMQTVLEPCNRCKYWFCLSCMVRDPKTEKYYCRLCWNHSDLHPDVVVEDETTTESTTEPKTLEKVVYKAFANGLQAMKVLTIAIPYDEQSQGFKSAWSNLCRMLVVDILPWMTEKPKPSDQGSVLLKGTITPMPSQEVKNLDTPPVPSQAALKSLLDTLPPVSDEKEASQLPAGYLDCDGAVRPKPQGMTQTTAEEPDFVTAQQEFNQVKVGKIIHSPLGPLGVCRTGYFYALTPATLLYLGKTKAQARKCLKQNKLVDTDNVLGKTKVTKKSTDKSAIKKSTKAEKE